MIIQNLLNELLSLENTVKNLENSNNQMQDEIDVNDIWAIGIGIIALIIAIIALVKSRKN